MIEINLLPPEYRLREKTNVHLLGTMVVGVVVVGLIVLWTLSLRTELARREHEKGQLAEQKKGLEQEAAKVAKLKQEIARQKSRQDMIIQISQSKVMWSQKLAQFSDIMSRFPTFWLDNFTLTRPARGNGTVQMAVSAIGNDYREVARFRDSLKNNPNFAYHFGQLVSESVQTVSLGGKYANADQKMTFRVTLPVELGEVTR